MSRIGKKSIIIPDNVKADINNGVLTVVGPKGQLSADLFADVDVQIDEVHQHKGPVSLAGTVNIFVFQKTRIINQ